MTAMYQLTEEDGTVICELTAEEFIEANEDEECAEALRIVSSGEADAYPIGGGAMPITILRRVLDE